MMAHAARPRPRFAEPLGWALLAVPVLVAFLGPLVPAPAGPLARNSDPGIGVLGTDFAGRDVLSLVLHGGWRALLVALAATLAVQVLGIGLGFVAGLTRRRWLDEAIMRPWDVVLSVPTLLLVVCSAALSGGSMLVLSTSVVVVGVAEAVRMTRAAARDIAAGPAVEAMRLGGEPWWRLCTDAVLPRIWRVLVAAACLQLAGALSLVATASFLGAGVSPQHADWAMMIENNRQQMVLQPWPVLVPCLLLASFVIGSTLVASGVSRTRKDVDPLAVLEGAPS